MSLIVKGLCHVLVSVAQISCNGFDHRVSATVLALEPQRLATIRTTTGATYEVVQHPSWQVGDQVACKRVASAHVQVPWERLDCQKVSD